jgi:hypothetical protein
MPSGPPTAPMHYPPPPATPKKGLGAGAIIAIILGVLAVLCGGLVVAVALSGNKPTTSSGTDGQPGGTTQTGTTQPGTTQPGNNGTAVAAAGSTVRDGKFEFKVAKVECGKKKVGNDVLGKTAQGQFCLVTLSIKNIGTEARTFDSSSQSAYDAAGAKYDTDGAASLYANPNGEAFLNGINPGNQVTAVIVFDVPTTVKLSTLELHDSAFSGGAKVAVG